MALFSLQSAHIFYIIILKSEMSSAPQIKVRRASSEDASAMMHIHLSCLTHSYPAVYSKIALQKWKSLITLEHYENKTKSKGWCFVAVVEQDSYEEEVVGYGYLNTNEECRIPNQYQCDLQIESLYVSAHYHKCGIGQKLMQAIETKALDLNCTCIAVVSSLIAVISVT